MRRIAWLYIGAVALACSLAIIAFGVIPKLWPYPGDFTVFWSAARSAPPYDWSLLKEAEIATVGGPVGPFAYPPTALLLLKPFGLLPFFPALFLWVGLGLSAFVFAGRTPLALLSAPVVIAAATGQTSLIVGALLIGAFTV